MGGGGGGLLTDLGHHCYHRNFVQGLPPDSFQLNFYNRIIHLCWASNFLELMTECFIIFL